MIKACDRAVQFGARCRNDATGDGKCVPHWTKQAPRAPEPTTILVKFKLFGATLHTAAGLFKYVPRMEDMLEAEHEVVAKAAGLQFKGIRASDKGPGDSGTAVFGKDGLRDISVSSLRRELEKAGFVLADVHTFEKTDGSGMLVLGYHKDGKPVQLRRDQQAFVDRSWDLNWKSCHVWANVPQHTAEVEDVRFKYILLEDRGDRLLIRVTRPKFEQPAEVAKTDLQNVRLETVHTVNLAGAGGRFGGTLLYAEGLWDAK